MKWTLYCRPSGQTSTIMSGPSYGRQTAVEWPIWQNHTAMTYVKQTDMCLTYSKQLWSDTTAKSYKVTPMPDTCTCTAMTPPPYLPHCTLYTFLTVNSVSDGVDSLLSGLHPPYSYMNSVSHGAGPSFKLAIEWTPPYPCAAP